MKAHIGVDDGSGLAHTVIGITAKDSDMHSFRYCCMEKKNESVRIGAMITPVCMSTCENKKRSIE